MNLEKKKMNGCYFRHVRKGIRYMEFCLRCCKSVCVLHRCKPNVLTCSRKTNLLIFPDLNQCLNRIINFSCISFGSIFACGRAESEACRGSTGVSKDTEDFKRREEMSFLNKGPDLFLFCIKVKA